MPAKYIDNKHIWPAFSSVYDTRHKLLGRLDAILIFDAAFMLVTGESIDKWWPDDEPYVFNDGVYRTTKNGVYATCARIRRAIASGRIKVLCGVDSKALPPNDKEIFISVSSFEIWVLKTEEANFIRKLKNNTWH